jgi:hypothetical protein
MVGPQGAGGADEGSESLDSILREAIKEAGGASDVDIDIEGQGPIAIQIEARAAFGDVEENGDPDAAMMDEDVEGGETAVVWAEGGGLDEEPETQVFIAVDGPEGLELPEELKEKLAQKAQEMAERLRERLEQAEADGEPLPALDAAGTVEERRQYFDRLRESTAKFERAKEALRQDFVNDVQSQLSAEQLERWPGLERALTRIKTLPDGRLDGERTDLIAIVEGLHLDGEQQAALAEALEAYELQLHEALVARNAFVREAQSKVDGAIEQGRFTAALATVDQASRLRVAVRGVNEQFADTIAERLGPGAGDAFRAQVRRQSYPIVYRTTRGQQAFRGARGLEALEAETRSAIDELATVHAAELEAANERLRQAIRRHQPREPRLVIEGVRSMMAGGEEPLMIGDEDDPVRQAMRKRSELDERYMKQLYALLTPEQVERLPKLPSQVKRGPIVIERSITD